MSTDQSAGAIRVLTAPRDRALIVVESIEQIAEHNKIVASGLMKPRWSGPADSKPGLVHDLDRGEALHLSLGDEGLGQINAAGVRPGEMQKMPHVRSP